MSRTNLYLDIDGVLLGKRAGRIALAKGADEFLEFVICNFDCYWLTTHCQGDAETAVARLAPFVSYTTKRLLSDIKPTRFNVLKTEALPGEKPFYWIEDRPLASEILFLKTNELLSRWLRVDTYKNGEDLITCQHFLKRQSSCANVSIIKIIY